MHVQAEFLKKYANSPLAFKAHKWRAPSKTALCNAGRGNHLQLIGRKVFNEKLYLCCRTNKIP